MHFLIVRCLGHLSLFLSEGTVSYCFSVHVSNRVREDLAVHRSLHLVMSAIMQADHSVVRNGVGSYLQFLSEIGSEITSVDGIASCSKHLQANLRGNFSKKKRNRLQNGITTKIGNIIEGITNLVNGRTYQPER